jgi:hypothetical protein
MFQQAQQFYRKVPDLILTPFFANGSTWPSYHIKPMYNDIEAPPVKSEETDKKSVEDNTSYYQNYLSAAGSIAANVGMQPHTQHTNIMGQQYMYPTMPYYIPATNVAEQGLYCQNGQNGQQVMYQPNYVCSQSGIAV